MEHLEHPKEHSVHLALSLAAIETQKDNQPLVTGSFRVEQSVKDAMEEVCARHGTSPSKFYRKCAQLLIQAYGYTVDAKE